jgi:hypothetical protein
LGDVEELLAERAIRRVILRYCRGVDRLDQELVRSCYHAHSTDSHGSFSGTVDEFIEWVWRILGRYSMTMHFIGNLLIEVDHSDPERARAETYGIAFHRTAEAGPAGNLTTGFRFIDDLAHRPVWPGGPAEWRITRRVATTEWVRIDRLEDQWAIPPGMLQGSRDSSDPVYRPISAG